MAVLTIDEILKRKHLIDENKYEFYHSKVYDMDIKIDDVEPQELLDIVNETDEDEHHRQLKIIYLACPIFKEPMLHEEFAERIKEPYDIIKIILRNNLGEIADLTRFILKKYGLLADEDIEAVKKQ